MSRIEQQPARQNFQAQNVNNATSTQSSGGVATPPASNNNLNTNQQPSPGSPNDPHGPQQQQLRGQLPSTPAPSVSELNPGVNGKTPEAGLQSGNNPNNSWAPQPDAVQQQLAKDLNGQNAPQLPQPPDPTTQGAQDALNYRLQQELNQAQPKLDQSNQSQDLNNQNQRQDPTQLQQQQQQLQQQQPDPTQQLNKPPEATPEAPVANPHEINQNDLHDPRNEPRVVLKNEEAKAGNSGLDPRHPSAQLLTDPKAGQARLAKLLTPAALSQDETEGPHAGHAKAATRAGVAAVQTEETEETPESPRAAGESPAASPAARATTAAEAAARLGAERAAMMLQALSAAGQPLVAVVWTDIFRMQQARLDQLTSNRAVDEEGEMAPATAEEARMRKVRIRGVDLHGREGRGGDRADLWAEAMVEDPLAGIDVYFRAALLATALQRPQIVTRMFKAATPEDTQRIRFFRREKAARFLEQWHELNAGQVPMSALPPLPADTLPAIAMATAQGDTSRLVSVREDLQTWMEAAESAYAKLLADDTLITANARGARRSEQALEMIHGREAHSVTVSVAMEDAASMWGHIIRTNPPYDEPVVAITKSDAPDGLLGDHAYAVLGTFRRGPDWMVALCNPAGEDAYSDSCGIFGMPFDRLLRNSDALTMLRRVRR